MGEEYYKVAFRKFKPERCKKAFRLRRDGEDDATILARLCVQTWDRRTVNAMCRGWAGYEAWLEKQKAKEEGQTDE